jgi:NNP family nitrate/nitrite transporter-like MFS transporter
MPYIMEIFLSITGSNIGLSWRLCMIVPFIMHCASAYFISTGRDLPDGSYKELEASGVKQKSKGSGNVLALGFSNTNALIMLITYGLCFGVELTMNNKLTPYFSRYYGMHPTVAGPLAACFSLMNLAARAWGGCLSDALAKKFGLRGRIAGMWVIQTLEGLMCVFMGLVTLPYDSPDEFKYDDVVKYPNIQGVFEYGAVKYLIPGVDGELRPCSSDLIRAPKFGMVDGVSEQMPVAAESLIMIKDPALNCVHSQNTLAVTMVCMLVFSIFVQMAEGLHFGIVPFISRPALGVVSGMVGAGGNAGALIGGQFVIGTYDQMDAGFIRLGIVIMTMSLLMHFIYFPDEGGILLPKGLPFNPQLIKEKTNQRGADELDFSKSQATV